MQIGGNLIGESFEYQIMAFVFYLAENWEALGSGRVGCR